MMSLSYLNMGKYAKRLSIYPILVWLDAALVTSQMDRPYTTMFYPGRKKSREGCWENLPRHLKLIKPSTFHCYSINADVILFQDKLI